MKRKRLKPIVKKISVLLVLIVIGFVITNLLNDKTQKASKMNEEFTYVNDYIFDSYYPVVKSEEKIAKPYNSEKVKIYKYYYEKDADEETQKNSIIYHDGIYLQNSGVDYESEEQFDVLSSLSGTVTKITDDTLLGKTVEIKNNNEIVMLYQSLSDISVKKGDTVSQGQIIGKSGTCSLNNDVKNGLHFEVYINGGSINPEKNYDKLVKEVVNN